MAERHVLVTIRIDPAGAFCGVCEWTDDEDEGRRLSQWEADMCEAWLVRARAALGGGS